MENAVREMTGEISGAITLGASTTIAEYMLPALLGDFKAKYPDVHLRLKVTLGVVEAPVANKNLLVEVCRIDQLVAIVPTGHPLAGKSKLKLSELVQYPFICREQGSGTREVIQEYMISQGIEREQVGVCLELGSSEAIKGAVQAGMGVSILSRTAIGKELQLGILKGIPLDPPLERPFSFVRPQLL